MGRSKAESTMIYIELASKEHQSPSTCRSNRHFGTANGNGTKVEQHPDSAMKTRNKSCKTVWQCCSLPALCMDPISCSSRSGASRAELNASVET